MGEAKWTNPAIGRTTAGSFRIELQYLPGDHTAVINGRRPAGCRRVAMVAVWRFRRGITVNGKVK
jgi:hypothetical protein